MVDLGVGAVRGEVGQPPPDQAPIRVGPGQAEQLAEHRTGPTTVRFPGRRPGRTVLIGTDGTGIGSKGADAVAARQEAWAFTIECPESRGWVTPVGAGLSSFVRPMAAGYRSMGAAEPDADQRALLSTNSLMLSRAANDSPCSAEAPCSSVAIGLRRFVVGIEDAR